MHYCRPADLVSLTALTAVRHLSLSITLLHRLQSMQQLTCLRWLELQSAEAELSAGLQRSLSRLSGLQHLHLACKSEQLPSISSLQQLTSLDLTDCSALSSLPSLAGLTELQSLRAIRCSMLSSLHISVGSLSTLTNLDLAR